MYMYICSICSQIYNAHLSSAFERLPVIKTVFAICQWDHPIRLLVHLEFNGAIALHPRKVSAQPLLFVLLSHQGVGGGLKVPSMAPTENMHAGYIHVL